MSCSSVSFLLLLLPRPPSSTLFPYTTLFRSRSRRRWPLLLRGISGFQEAGFLPTAWALRRWSGPARFSPEKSCFLDRKSTRLNSSHLGISYAVFCLKKKNKNSVDAQNGRARG